MNWWLILLLAFLMCTLSASGEDEHLKKASRRQRKPNVLLVVPGLGRRDRLEIVAHNVRILSQQQYQNTSSLKFHLDCTIYVYAHRSNDFWQGTKDLSYLYDHCKMIESPGQKISANLFMVQPHFIQNNYDYVFIMLDDVKIPTPADFSLPSMIQLLQCNNLHLLSPQVNALPTFLFVFTITFFFFFQVMGATCCGNRIMKDFPREFMKFKCCGFRSVMQVAPESKSIAGYHTVYAELFAWVMTMRGYHILWDLLSPNLNPYGWGYDWWYYGYAQMLLNTTDIMGVTSDYKIMHVQGTEQTDNTPKEQKRDGLHLQETHYMRNLHIPLKKFGEDYESESLKTAITGHLKRCIF
jgi:hypothetical protein